MLKVKLVSQEQEILEVDANIAAKSKVIKKMIDNTGADEDIQLPEVRF